MLSEPETSTVLNYTVEATSLTTNALLPYYTYGCTVGAVTAGGGTFSDSVGIQATQGSKHANRQSQCLHLAMADSKHCRLAKIVLLDSQEM